MSKNFGRPDPYEFIEAPPHTHTDPYDDDVNAADDFRQRAVAFIVLGIIGLIPPITPIGIVMIIFGGVMLLFSPVTKANHEQMISETQRTGNGCGWLLIAWVMGVVVIFIAFSVGWGAVQMMIERGMVMP